jgi:signal transduction histidine kinase
VDVVALRNAILNSASFSSIATDEKGVIQIFNVGAERMLGYTASDVLNKITPADISDPQEVIARAAASSLELATAIPPGFDGLVFKASRGFEDIYESTYIRKDGSRLPVIVSVTALRDDRDRIIGYLLIGIDNTTRKRVEAEQQKLDQRLRNQQFYTRSLIESDRKQAEQMLQEENVELEGARSVAEQTVERLEEVERLKTGFLSTVSHELRTPLTSIRGSLGLLASGALGTLSDEVVEVVAVAERNAVRLMALINDILDLERLETGKIELQFAQVPVESILRRALESLATFGHKHGVIVEAPEVSAMIWADADRIVQVLVNLLSNAVKFSPPGGVVTIGVRSLESLVEFRVTDRGRGVPVAKRRAIFERFRQVETSDAREKGGTGLGLAICKSIVEQHGGTIGVESEDAGGTSFWFRVATRS